MTDLSGVWRPVFSTLVVIGLIIASTVIALHVARPSDGLSENIPPPPDGYFTLLPVGAYRTLPSDAAAAARVRRSTWEPRRANASYNRVMPEHLRLRPVPPSAHAMDPRWNKYIIGRITGHFTGTTDEIFQWAAAKWGLPDNLLRAIAYMESDWYQRNKGDYVHERAKCQPGYRHVPCPVTFGIVGTKSTSWPGVFPWNRNSTAAAVNVLGGSAAGLLRGLGVVAPPARQPVPWCLPRR